MHFTKVAILAYAGFAAANLADNQAALEAARAHLAESAQITAAPEERRDLIDDIVSSAEVFIDEVGSEAGSVWTKAKSVYSDVKSHVKTGADGVETWIATKGDAAESAWESAKGAASSAIADATDDDDDNDNAASALAVGSQLGVIVAAAFAGAYLLI